MKIKLLAIGFLVGLLNILNAQDFVNKNEMVGFACYWEGSQSKTVKKVTQKLKHKNYNSIAKLLTSNNNAERFLAVITLEKLAKLNKYSLKESEKNLISEIKQSDELVSVCSGCTYFKNIKLNKMFSEEMLVMTTSWLDYNIN